MKSATPLLCNMDVFTPAERDNHVQSTRLLVQQRKAIRPASDGYEFIFTNNPETLTQLTEFIANERRCCQFLEFTLKTAPNHESVSLTLTGPEGTQEFLREEFTLPRTSGDEAFA